MIKTLKITSIITAAAAAVFIVFLIFSGLRTNTGAETILNAPSVADEFRKNFSKNDKSEDATGPLVKQAHAFALRINPPPPPPEIKPAGTAPSQHVKAEPKPSIPVKPRFELVATVCCNDYPEKSLALINTLSEGMKWYRPGESIGYLEIHKIDEGMVLLYQGGRENSRLLVPKPENKSLLKSDAAIAATLPNPSAAGPVIPAGIAPDTVSIPVAADTSQPATSAAAVNSEIPTVKLNPEQPQQEAVPVVTVKDQITMIDENIEEIKTLMSQPGNVEDDELKELEKKGFEELLQILAEEKKKLESTEKIQSAEKTPEKKQK